MVAETTGSAIVTLEKVLNSIGYPDVLKELEEISKNHQTTQILTYSKFFEEFIRTLEYDFINGETIVEEDKKPIPKEAADMIGGVFSLLYELPTSQAKIKLENLFNSDAKIKYLTSQGKLPKPLAEFCYSFLYAAAKYATAAQAKKFLNEIKCDTEYHLFSSKPRFDDFKPEYCFLAYDVKSYSNGLYDYLIAKNFELCFLGKTSSEEKKILKLKINKDYDVLLNLLLDLNLDEKFFEKEPYGNLYTLQFLPFPKEEIDSIRAEFKKSAWLDYVEISTPDSKVEVIPYECKENEGFQVKVNGEVKYVRLCNPEGNDVWNIPTSRGEFSWYWHQGGKEFVERVAEIYFKNKKYFHETPKYKIPGMGYNF